METKTLVKMDSHRSQAVSSWVKELVSKNSFRNIYRSGKNSFRRRPQLKVTFSDPILTGMWVIPAISDEDKSALFYSSNECENMKYKKKRVRFARKRTVNINNIYERSVQEKTNSFYETEALNKFVLDYILLTDDGTVRTNSYSDNLKFSSHIEKEFNVLDFEFSKVTGNKMHADAKEPRKICLKSSNSLNALTSYAIAA